MRRRRLKKSNAIAEINVVPFIDVMLVLLVIFMVAAPLLTTGIKVQLPQATTKKIQQTKALTISINSENKIFIDHSKRAISLRALQAKLRAQIKINPKQQVLLQADKNSRYDIIAKALGATQQAGIKAVAIITKNK